MPAITLEFVEDFSRARDATTIGAPEWTSTSGSGADIVPCPSGFGWALAQDTSQATNHSIQRNITTARNGMGFAAILSLDMPGADTDWRPIYRAFLNSSAPSLWLRYQPSTNTFKLSYTNVTTETDIIGGTFAGPADPTLPFHVAIEVTRNATTGTAKAWLEGALVLNLSGVNTGSASHTFNRNVIFAPVSTGAGQTTVGNVMAWNTSLHSWDGGRKVLQRLAPISDVSSSGWTGSAPYWTPLEDTSTTTATTTNGSIRVALADLDVEPESTYGVFVFWQPGDGTTSGTGFATLHEFAADRAGASVTGLFQFGRDYWGAPDAGGEWTKANVNLLELSITRTAGTLTVPYGHIVLLRSVEVQGPQTGDLAVTLDALTLDSSVNVTQTATLAVTLDDLTPIIAAQVNNGVIADGATGDSLTIELEALSLAADVELEVIASVLVTLDDLPVISSAIVGSLGPFARRRIIVVS